MTVAREQRHTRAHRCPICDGADGDPRGKERRCSGFTTEDGFAHCSREEHAGSIAPNSAGLFAHRLAGDCRCGTSHGPGVASTSVPRAVITYDYRDEHGELLFQVVRTVEKKFWQRRPNGEGEWLNGLGDTPRVLYRLPELIAADPKAPVYILEGEKDADTAAALGMIATCNPMGALKWAAVAELARTVIAGRDVVIVADADEPGRRHASDVSRSLAGAAKSVRVVECPEGHKDLSAWVERGATLPQILAHFAVAAAEAGPLAGLSELSRVAVVGRAALTELAQRPILYIWQDIAIVGIVVVLAGGAGCGKTTLLFLILVARMNLGAPVKVLGRDVTPAPPGTFVVLIEGEHADTSAARKLVRSCALLGIDEVALDRVILIARKSVRIGSPAWEDIVALVRRGLVSDIALDTLARVAPGDANDEREQVAIFDLVTQAIDAAPTEATKPVVWANAHTKKGAEVDLEAVSGSTQRTGQADTVLMVNAERRDGRVTSSRVTFLKLREDPDDYPSPVEFTVTKTAIVVADAPKANDERPLEVRILERLQLGPQTKNKLATDLSRNKDDIDTAITNLFDARQITTSSVEIRGRSFKAFALRSADERSSTSTPDATPDPYSRRTSPDRHRTPSREGQKHAV